MMSEKDSTRTSHVGMVVVWALGLLAVYLAVSFVLAPPLSVYLLAGWWWGALAGLAWLGVIAFLVRFGPYLFARWLARTLRQEVEAVVETDLERAERARERSESINDWSDLKDTNDQ